MRLEPGNRMIQFWGVETPRSIGSHSNPQIACLSLERARFRAGAATGRQAICGIESFSMKYPSQQPSSSILSDDTDGIGRYDVLREDLKESNLVFIHSKLDDAGLTPNAFRVYCHIARRGMCFSIAKTMAQVCCLGRSSIFEAIKELEQRKMVLRTARPGQTTLLTLTLPSQWTDKPEMGPVRITDTTRPYNGHLPVRNTDTEGNPLKGDPMKGLPQKEKDPPVKIAELSASMRISYEKELDRALEEKGTIKANYGPMQTWCRDDVARFAVLTKRIKELKALLGVVI